MKECTIDFLMETTLINIYVLYYVKCYVFIIMSISVMLHELWCTVRDMLLGKCSIVIIGSDREP